jgi:HEAT repeat protein
MGLRSVKAMFQELDSPYRDKPVTSWINALGDPDPSIRMQAVVACASLKSGAKEAVPALTLALDDEAVAVRALAAWALGEIGVASSEVISALLKAGMDKNQDVRDYSARALGKIKPEALAELSSVDNAEPLSLRTRLEIAKHQWEKDGSIEAVLPTLLCALTSSDFFVRAGALRVLKSAGKEANPLLPLITPYLRDEHYLVRFSAIQVLETMGVTDDDLVLLVRPLVEDENELVNILARTIVREKGINGL